MTHIHTDHVIYLFDQWGGATVSMKLSSEQKWKYSHFSDEAEGENWRRDSVSVTSKNIVD